MAHDIRSDSILLPGTETRPTAAAAPDDTAPGLTFNRFFSRPDADPFDEIEWETRSAD